MSFFISGRSITCPAPSPVLSLRQSFENLKPDGYLALETQVYDHPQDPSICYFMHMQNNDPTNIWALSTPVSKKNLELIGFSDVREVKKIAVSMLAEHISPIMVVACKPVLSRSGLLNPLKWKRYHSWPGDFRWRERAVVLD
jgi:hypothetical protein